MLFDINRHAKTHRHRRVYALFELGYTLVDFFAAVCFLVGSVMFLYADPWQRIGTWLFIVGSVAFAAKPTIRLAREVRLAALGETDDVAERLGK